MAKKPRLADWLGSGRGVQKPEDAYPPGWKDTAVDTSMGTQYLLGALRSKAPGMWSANLLELSRHFTSVAFLAINTLANQSASSDWGVYQRTPDPDDGDMKLPMTEPVCQLLEDPNTEDSFGDFRYQLTQQLGLTGLTLIWVPRANPLGLANEMYVLPTASCLPWPPSPTYPHGSYLVQPYYPYGPFSTVPSYQSAAGARIPAEQVIRIKNPHPILRYDGYAVLTAISRQVDTVEMIDLARWNTQQNGVDPTIAINFDPALFNPKTVDLVRLRQQLEALYAGPTKSGKIMFNPFGGEVSRLSNAPSEMAWQEGWLQLVDFGMACYGVPKSVAGMQDSVSFATLYAGLKQFYLISLNPTLRRQSDGLNKHLIRPDFGDDLYLKMTGQKINDDELLEKQLATDDRAGIRTVNERRKLRDLKPLKGPAGDRLVGVPAPAQTPGDQPPGDQPGDQGEREQDRDVEARRPGNVAAQGNPRGSPGGGPGARKGLQPLTGPGGDRLAGVLDRCKVRGTVGHLNGKSLPE